MLAVCQKLQISTALEDLLTLCGTDEHGSSLAGLRDAAVANGLEAMGVKIGADELAAFQGPVIAHLWNNHFVVVEPDHADTLKVIDPPAEPKVVKTADFQKAYSGFALLIAKDASAFPKPKDEGPDLRFTGYDWDFGSLYDGDKQTHSFKCRNAGSAELVISKVEASCSCIVPITPALTIPPGGEGEISVLFDSAGERGGVGKTVYVHSNDPITPVVQLQVGGYVKSKTLRRSPRELNLGEARRESNASREVFVPSTEEEKVQVKSAKCDLPYLSASISENPNKELSGTVIRVALKPGAPVGPLKGKLTIETDHPFEPKAEIPITATIKGDIDLDRDSFFLGLSKQGKTAVSSVTISTVGKDPLKITKVDNPLNCVSVEIKPKTEGKGYVLTATLKPDTPLGNIKGEVTVHTNNPDQPEIRIPVYAYVEK